MGSVVTRLEAQNFILSEVTTPALEFPPYLLLNGYWVGPSRGKAVGASSWPLVSVSMSFTSDLVPPGFLAELLNCRACEDYCLLRCDVVKYDKITYVSGEHSDSIFGERSWYTHGDISGKRRDVISQKTIIFTVTAVRTSNITCSYMPHNHRSVVPSIDALVSS